MNAETKKEIDLIYGKINEVIRELSFNDNSHYFELNSLVNQIHSKLSNRIETIEKKEKDLTVRIGEINRQLESLNKVTVDRISTVPEKKVVKTVTVKKEKTENSEFNTIMKAFFDNKQVFKGQGYPKIVWQAAYTVTIEKKSVSTDTVKKVREFFLANPTKWEAVKAVTA